MFIIWSVETVCKESECELNTFLTFPLEYTFTLDLPLSHLSLALCPLCVQTCRGLKCPSFTK